MAHEKLVSLLQGHAGSESLSLENYFKQKGQEAWNRLNDVARRNPEVVDDEVLAWVTERRVEAPANHFFLLLTIAARDEKRRIPLLERYRSLMPEHPAEALRCAGYNLHEYNLLLDDEWLATADALFDHHPEGAWGVFESAAMYRPELISPVLIDAFERRRSHMPRGYFVSLLSLASHWPDRTAGLLERVLRAFPEHPSHAVDATAFAGRQVRALLTPELVGAVLRHFGAAPDKAWEFFEGAARTLPDLFDRDLLGTLSARATGDPGTLLEILGHLMEAKVDRMPELMDRYVELVRAHPEKGIKNVYHRFQREEIRLVRPDLVAAVCAGFRHAPYEAYSVLWHCVDDRPELIGLKEIGAALENIPLATNRAFGFFRNLIKVRPEFTREGTLALFEALAQEPVYRAFERAEQMEGIIAISEAAHIKTGLENALREPPRVGSRRARALMAIMFRQKLRARRHVLLEALRYAATVVLWRKNPSEKFSPIWDFVLFIIDHASDDAVSTAAAEQFLEGAFQLHYLCRTGAEHEEFLRKLDLGYPPKRPFPPGLEFMDSDLDLSQLYHLVLELGERFRTEPQIAPLRAFMGELEAAESELRALDTQIAPAVGRRRRGLEARRRALGFLAECRRNPDYLAAFGDPRAEARLSQEARKLLRRERKDLSKHLRDSLRAEAIRIAIAAVDRCRQDLYRHRLREALGREVGLSEVEPMILPAFLWFQAISHMKNNCRYLKRLIEDRISKRPHDWLWTEPPALEWAARVRDAQPGVVLERWRAPFAREYHYRPQDALAEKRRRIRSDLLQARALLEKAGAKGLASEDYAALAASLEELKKHPPRAEEEAMALPPLAPDPALLQEIEMNLERARISEQTLDSDFEGRLLLSVETDPFEILFMGEYGFASCLSLRGSNAWSAVSNAIDIDKVIVWAREPGGNVVGRRLLALTPKGVLVFRTYTNRHGLALDRAFDEFVEEYAVHCGTKVTHGGRAGPLLSDRWYDDGAL